MLLSHQASLSTALPVPKRSAVQRYSPAAGIMHDKYGAAPGLLASSHAHLACVLLVQAAWCLGSHSQCVVGSVAVPRHGCSCALTTVRPHRVRFELCWKLNRLLRRTCLTACVYMVHSTGMHAVARCAGAVASVEVEGCKTRWGRLVAASCSRQGVLTWCRSHTGSAV